MGRVLPALLLALFVNLQTATASLTSSPLFGPPGGGDPFDDGITAIVPCVVHIASLSICHGDGIDRIQANYTLQDGKVYVGFPHGARVTKNCTRKNVIEFTEGETIVYIEGKIQITYRYVSQLTLFTSTPVGLPSIYGPFGLGGDSDIPFSIVGSTMGIFGRSGDLLDAIGVLFNICRV